MIELARNPTDSNAIIACCLPFDDVHLHSAELIQCAECPQLSSYTDQTLITTQEHTWRLCNLML